MYFWVYVFKIIYLYWTLFRYLGFLSLLTTILIVLGLQVIELFAYWAWFLPSNEHICIRIRASQKRRIIDSSINTGIFINYLPCKCRFSNHLDAFNVSLKIRYLLFFIKCLDNILKIKMYFHVWVHFKDDVIEFL